jgi:hypothetical protein
VGVLGLVDIEWFEEEDPVLAERGVEGVNIPEMKRFGSFMICVEIVMRKGGRGWYLGDLGTV